MWCSHMVVGDRSSVDHAGHGHRLLHMCGRRQLGGGSGGEGGAPSILESSQRDGSLVEQQ